MIGIIDVGGGMRDVYSAGIYDYLADEKIDFEYCIGVSAGSANMISYVSRQRGRNIKFYTEYAFRKEYMSFKNLLRYGSYIGLDYIYSGLCNTDGECPLDYNSFKANKCSYTVVATDAKTGKPHYFTKADVGQDNYDILKASCAIPVVCKPYNIGENYYYDGGVSDPMPYKKAFSDGCDRLVVILTRPISYEKQPQKLFPVVKRCLKKYPNIANEISQRHSKYNNCVKELVELQKQGRVLIMAPSDCHGVNTLTRNKDSFIALYNEGYKDAVRIKAFYYNENKSPSAVLPTDKKNIL